MINGVHYRSIWYDHDLSKVMIIDQRWLPHDFRIVSLDTLDAFAVAIRDMWVRARPYWGNRRLWNGCCDGRGCDRPWLRPRI